MSIGFLNQNYLPGICLIKINMFRSEWKCIQLCGVASVRLHLCKRPSVYGQVHYWVQC